MAIVGENKLVRIPMLQEDEVTPLLLSSLSYISARIYQGRRSLVTYVFGVDNEIRQGTTTSELEVEIPVRIANLFSENLVVGLEVEIRVTNAEFTTEGYQQDKKRFEIMTIDGL